MTNLRKPILIICMLACLGFIGSGVTMAVAAHSHRGVIVQRLADGKLKTDKGQDVDSIHMAHVALDEVLARFSPDQRVKDPAGAFRDAQLRTSLGLTIESDGLTRFIVTMGVILVLMSLVFLVLLVIAFTA